MCVAVGVYMWLGEGRARVGHDVGGIVLGWGAGEHCEGVVASVCVCGVGVGGAL